MRRKGNSRLEDAALRMLARDQALGLGGPVVVEHLQLANWIIEKGSPAKDGRAYSRD
jgi:hypothetical protein